MSRRTNIICVVICLAVMAICIGLGAYYRQSYISLGGVIFCAVGLTVLGIVNKIMILREIGSALKEIKEEKSENPENVDEAAQAGVAPAKVNKSKFKAAPTSGKIKVIALLGSFGLFLFIMFVGIMFARVGTLPDGTITKYAIIGFILMGIGGGGFVLEIITLVIISHIINR